MAGPVFGGVPVASAPWQLGLRQREAGVPMNGTWQSRQPASRTSSPCASWIPGSPTKTSSGEEEAQTANPADRPMATTTEKMAKAYGRSVLFSVFSFVIPLRASCSKREGFYAEKVAQGTSPGPADRK